MNEEGSRYASLGESLDTAQSKVWSRMHPIQYCCLRLSPATWSSRNCIYILTLYKAFSLSRKLILVKNRTRVLSASPTDRSIMNKNRHSASTLSRWGLSIGFIPISTLYCIDTPTNLICSSCVTSLSQNFHMWERLSLSWRSHSSKTMAGNPRSFRLV